MESILGQSYAERIEALTTQLTEANYELVNRIAELSEATAQLTAAQEECEKLRKDLKATHISGEVAVTAILNRAERAEAKLSRYEGGVEVEGIVYSYGTLLDSILIDSKALSGMNNQRVRVIVLKEEGNE